MTEILGDDEIAEIAAEPLLVHTYDARRIVATITQMQAALEVRVEKYERLLDRASKIIVAMSPRPR